MESELNSDQENDRIHDEDHDMSLSENGAEAKSEQKIDADEYADADQNDEEKTDDLESEEMNVTEDDLESEEEEDEDEEEPRLKYNRLQGISETLSKDAISCLAISDRFLAVGTHMGHVHIMDLLGTPIKQFSSHSASVNQVSIETNGEYVASASDDGNVAIYGLYTPEILTTFFKRPIKGVCLEPDYSKKTSRQFVSGGLAESLTLTGKGWFGNSNVVLHSGDGPILTVSWRGNYIVWANEQGVHAYDVSLSQKFAKIERPPNSPRADLFKCSIAWISDSIFLLGWADSVKKIEIKNRPKHDIASGHPLKMAEIVCQFRTEYVVSGLAPMDDYILLLGFNTNLSAYRDVDKISAPAARKKSEPPEIHIVDFNGEIVSSDVLTLTGFEHYQANDYRLEYATGISENENTYYIISPKDIVVAKPRDLDDHIEWLVERKKYGKALKAAESAGLTTTAKVKVGTIVEIGQKHISALLAEGRFDEAAAECPKILRQDTDLWEQWVFTFAEASQLDSLYPYIKLEKPRLSTTVYELFLVHFLNTNLSRLLEVVILWPTDLYTIRNVIAAVDAVFQREPSNHTLLEILYELFLKNRQYDDALKCGLELRKIDALDLVERHNLFPTLQHHLPLLFNYATELVEQSGEEFDPMKQMVNSRSQWDVSPLVLQTRRAAESRAVRIVSENPDLIPPSFVVDALKTSPRHLHIYLDALNNNEDFDASIYHNQQIYLYAEYDRPGLMKFLRTSSSYDLAKAYQLAEDRDFVPEMVYLLGKMGNNRRALMLIIERLNDVEQAIEFAKRQDDNDLWDEFLKYAMDKAPFIVGLLENAGTHINPLRIVQKIPKGLEIPGLRQALIKILADSSVQMSLREGCERILVGDTWENLFKLTKLHRSAVLLDEIIPCFVCENTMKSQDGSSLVLFFCKHAFHRSCLQAVEPKREPEEQVAQESSSVGMTRSRSSSFVSRNRGGLSDTRNSKCVKESISCPICRSSFSTNEGLITLT